MPRNLMIFNQNYLKSIKIYWYSISVWSFIFINYRFYENVLCILCLLKCVHVTIEFEGLCDMLPQPCWTKHEIKFMHNLLEFLNCYLSIKFWIENVCGDSLTRFVIYKSNQIICIDFFFLSCLDQALTILLCILMGYLYWGHVDALFLSHLGSLSCIRVIRTHKI